MSNNVDNNDKICNKHKFVFLTDVNEKIMLIKKIVNYINYNLLLEKYLL